MKKVILIITAIVMVASGVAAVSAYEAHTVNVKATVENALLVSTNETDFGVVFPEEWVEQHFTANLSDSFYLQERVDSVNISVYAEHKDDGEGGYYPWLGEALYLKINTSTGYIGPNTTGPDGATEAKDVDGNQMQAVLDKTTDPEFDIGVYLDVPVFFDYYNSATDVDNKPREDWADKLLAKAWGLNPLTEWQLVSGNASMILPSGVDPKGYEMGVDLKIQVVDIW